MTSARRSDRLLSMFILIVLAAVVLATPLSRRGTAGAEATFCLGFILLFGHYLAGLLAGLKLPSITGYIIAGVLAGPYGINLLSGPVVRHLQLFDDAALAIIALIAGGELKLRMLRSRGRALAALTAGQMMFAFAGAGAAALVIGGRLGVPAGGAGPYLALVLLLGLVTAARSPSTTIGVITETRAKGPVTELIVGVTVILDVLILLLMALVIPAADVLASSAAAFSMEFARDLVVAVSGSIAAGVFFGLLVGSYIRWVGGYLSLFLVGAGFVGSLVCRHYHLEPLLAFMIAGFIVENFSSRGDDLIAGLERSAFPVYVIFFSISGASIDLDALSRMWVAALLLVTVRAAAFAAGEWAAGRLAAELRQGTPLLWCGFLSQAGVTIGLASTIERKFVWGGDLKTVILAVVAVNQLIGPVLLKWLLARKGELGGMTIGDEVKTRPPR